MCREIRTAPLGLGSSLQSAQEQGPRETTKTLEISAKITEIYISPKSREEGKARTNFSTAEHMKDLLLKQKSEVVCSRNKGCST